MDIEEVHPRFVVEDFKTLGTKDLMRITNYINRVWNTETWPEGFLEVIIIPLKNKANALSSKGWCIGHLVYYHICQKWCHILKRRLQNKGEE